MFFGGSKSRQKWRFCPDLKKNKEIFIFCARNFICLLRKNAKNPCQIWNLFRFFFEFFSIFFRIFLDFLDCFQFCISSKQKIDLEASSYLIQHFYLSFMPFHVDAHRFSLPSRGEKYCKNEAKSSLLKQIR